MSATRRTLVLHTFAETPDAMPAALRVARHAAETLGPDASVQVVVQGGAVRGLTSDSAFAEDIRTTLMAPGVEMRACENSMHRTGVDRGALLSGVGTVPSAVGFIAEQQWAGAAYLRI